MITCAHTARSAQRGQGDVKRQNGTHRVQLRQPSARALGVEGSYAGDVGVLAARAAAGHRVRKAGATPTHQHSLEARPQEHVDAVEE
jgi:hypothetical protein